MINIKKAMINMRIEKIVKEYRELKLKLEEFKRELDILKEDEQVQKYIKLSTMIDETPKKMMELSNKITVLQYQKEELSK